MAVKAVVFDLDGTIVTFNIDYLKVRAEVRAFLLTENLPSSILPEKGSIFGMLKKAKIILADSSKSSEKIKRIRKEVSDIAEKYELEAAEKTELFPGVVKTLKALRERNLKTGLCTINSEKAVNHILERFKIAGFFDAVVPRNRIENVKPDAEHLETILDILDVEPHETVVVGDGISDMECAKKLGAISVGLATGTSSETELLKAGADLLINNITELPATIERVNRFTTSNCLTNDENKKS